MFTIICNACLHNTDANVSVTVMFTIICNACLHNTDANVSVTVCLFIHYNWVTLCQEHQRWTGYSPASLQLSDKSMTQHYLQCRYTKLINGMASAFITYMVSWLDDQMHCCSIEYTAVTQYFWITQHFAREDNTQLINSRRKLIGTCAF